MKRASFFLMTFVLAFLVVWILFGARLGGIWIILIGLFGWAFLSWLLWQARKLQAKKLVYIGLGVLLGLFFPTSAIIESEKYFHYHLPQPFLSIVDILIYACFILALVLAAALLHAGVKMLQQRYSPPAAEEVGQVKTDDWILVIVFSLSASLLLLFFHNLSGLIMWDNTYDAIEGFWLFMPILVSLVCGTVLVVNLPGKLKLVSLMFFLFVPVLTYIVYVPAMNIDFRSMTRERGDRITYAIEAYRQREGQYPQTLAQLTPGDLLTIEPPFIINGQNWCYDAEPDIYRLGYVEREHWSSPCYYGEVFNSAGDFSGYPPVCEAELAIFTPKFDTTGFFGCK